MTKSLSRTTAMIFAELAFIFAITAVAQDKPLPVDDFYGDIKTALASHYTGKIVRAKTMIPATRRGLEVMDGTLQNAASPTPPPVAAQPGDELVIKSFKVGDSSIEVVMDKNEPPKKRSMNPFLIIKFPRITLRFTRELTTKDLTIENINRLLSTAVDVSSLNATPEKSGLTQVSVASPQTEPPMKPEAKPESKPESKTEAKSEANANEQSLPAARIVGDLQAMSPGLAELTVESSAKSRVYIDGAYSGPAPRTVRLRAGVHTILVVGDGYAPWEQRLFIQGGKASVVRAELQNK